MTTFHLGLIQPESLVRRRCVLVYTESNRSPWTSSPTVRDRLVVSGSVRTAGSPCRRSRFVVTSAGSVSPPTALRRRHSGTVGESPHAPAARTFSTLGPWLATTAADLQGEQGPPARATGASWRGGQQRRRTGSRQAVGGDGARGRATDHARSDTIDDSSDRFGALEDPPHAGRGTATNWRSVRFSQVRRATTPASRRRRSTPASS